MAEERGRARATHAPWALALAVLLLAPFAEASVPRAATTDGAGLRIASLAEPSRLAPLAASDDVERLALFAGDELARDAHASRALQLEPWNAGELSLAPLASRVREASFSLQLGADVFDVESLRGPPPLSEDLCQGDDECLAGTRIGGLELSGPFFIKAEPPLSLGLQWACSVSSCGLADGKPLDPWGLCLGITDGPCSAVADSIKGAFEGAKDAVRSGLGSGAGSVAIDAVVSTGLDVVDTFLVDPLRAGEATGTAIGNDAGALDMTLAVVQDVGRGAALAGGAGSAAKAASRGVRAATRLPGAAGAAARTVGSSAMSRALTANVGGSRGFSLFSEFKGHLGEGLTYAERFLRGEKIVGKQITMTAGGGRARWDLLTQNRFNGQLKAVEAKLGRTAELSRQQPVVASAIEATGRAVVRGRKGVASLRSIGIEGGSVRSGVPLQNLAFVEQRFSFVETLLENPILPGLILQGATHGLDE